LESTLQEEFWFKVNGRRGVKELLDSGIDYLKFDRQRAAIHAQRTERRTDLVPKSHVSTTTDKLDPYRHDLVKASTTT
jgi:hypothetical protein